MVDIFSIFKTIKKTITRIDVLIIVGLVLLYLATRVIKLDGFPIFNDEGIYINWAKIAWHDATWRFISLTDGKQPLQTWGTIPFLKLFADNLLVGGRMFAVSMGFLAMSGVLTICWYLWGKKAGFWGALLYILTPYFLFYDRLALVDSGVNAGSIWILFLSIVLARRNRLDTALIYGIAGGFALLAKSSCQLFIGLSAFAPVLFFEKNLKKFVPKAINYFFLLGIGVIIAFAMYNIQRLSPFLHFVAEKNYTFISTPKELLHNPFQNVIPNIYNIPLYILWESGVIVILVGVAGLLALLRKDRKLGLYFLIWVVIPYIVVMFINKVLFPRYIIFLPTLFVILAAYFLDSFKKLQKVLIALIAVSVVYYHYTIIFNPWNIPFPDVDRGQYLEDWPAGWGIKEIMTYSREHSSDKPVILLGEGNFGMAGDVLNSSLKRSDKITVKGYWPLGLKELQDNQKELDTNHVYVVFTHRSEFPADWPIKLIKKYDKPGHKNSNIYLYELTK